jgi:hypothetical protein
MLEFLNGRTDQSFGDPQGFTDLISGQGFLRQINESPDLAMNFAEAPIANKLSHTGAQGAKG